MIIKSENKIPNNSDKKIIVIVKFITIMQKYSGKREISLEAPPDPREAIKYIIERFQLPWKDHLEKNTRIFINKRFLNDFLKSGEHLKSNDVIAFIPISGGG